ncbi:MAG: hypothetical protein KKB50_12525 [Planctomycetes bacterium]|nr:hypothetical protein [Planctomycetota bacterium]
MKTRERENVGMRKGESAGAGPVAKAVLAVVAASLPLVVAAGCSHVPNQWREDGPSTTANWDSPTAADVKGRFEPAGERSRGWDAARVASADGTVTHWPLYFEDPFEDKGAGRGEYRWGWEDFVAMPYCYSRFTLNWLMLPVSAIVTPPWTLMESDGVLSKQLLGYDHDATRAGSGVSESTARTEPAAEPVEREGDRSHT